jgi:mercuric ion transport protein
MARSLARHVLPLVSGLFVACALLQVFLAGLGVFDNPASFLTHRDFGYSIGMLTLVILVLALVGREPRRIVGLSALLLAQFALQSIFILQRGSLNAVAALHPVNGFLILLVAVAITRLAWAERLGADEPVEASLETSAAATPAEAR